ncbi:MAG: glycosyltransferase family 9 protein [Gemmatimonadota bacterium]|nr:glycosyltransferase family 9 protein [Gemmatimonadota bacterium]
MAPAPAVVRPPPGIEPPELPDEGTILVRVPNWVGDAVMALPALTAITERFESHTILVMSRGNVAPLYVGQKRVAEVVRAGGRGAGRLATARRALAKRRVALGVVMPHSMGSAIETAVGGVDRLWGFGGPMRRLVLDVTLPRRWYAGRHRWQEYALLAAAVTGRPVPERYPIVTGSGDVAAADALLAEAGLDEPGGPIVGLVPTSNARSRRWPVERFAEVASRLGRDGGRVVVFGASNEGAITREVVENADPEPVDWTGRSPLPVLAELFRRLDFLVTNDTGPMHIAYAVGTPLLALFGASREVVTGPRGGASEVLIHPIYCRPCARNRCAYTLGCLRGITVDRVVEHVRSRLDGGPARDVAAPVG